MLKVSMTEETLNGSLRVHNSLTNDKNLNKDFKNVILWVEPDLTVHTASYGITISIGDTIPAQVIVEGEELTERRLVQMNIKDIQNVLNAYKGVTSIFISSIDFIVEDTSKVIMHVHEKTTDSEKYGEQFDNVSKYLIRQSPVTEVVQKGISMINFNFEGQEIASEIFEMYLGTLYPQVVNEVNSATDSILFKEDFIYTRNSTNVMLMKNIFTDTLPSLQDFKINRSNIAIILDLINGHQTFNFERADLERNGVKLTIRVGDTVAVLSVPNTANGVDLTNYMTKEGAKLTLDRQYLVDVLKQASISPDTIKFTVVFNTEGKENDIKIESKTMHKPLIANEIEGSCDIAIEIRPDLLNRLIAGYSNKFSEDIVMYFNVIDNGGRQKIELTVEDRKGFWYTKIREIQPSRGVYWK